MGAPRPARARRRVEVMYGFGGDQEAAFQKDLNKFAQANGFTIKFTKAGSWDTEIRARVAGGNPPDVGLFPQPGVMCDLAKQKKVLAWDDADVTTATADMVNGFKGAGTCADGKVYGLPSAVSVKSLIWYDQPNWQTTGDQLPTTLDNMLTLSVQLKSQGKTPWCIAAESGNATGWPITDWIEDLVLRLAGPENYDKWVTGALKFNSPEIKPAFEYFQKIAFTEGWVRGGTKSIVATNFQTGGDAMFDDAARLLPVQAGQLRRRQGRLPGRRARAARHQGRRHGVPAEDRGRQPGSQRWRPGGGVQQRLQHSEAAQLRRQQGERHRRRQGRVLLAAQVASTSRCTRARRSRRSRDVLYKATAVRFDGSDLMPAKVGAGTFWTEPVKWISGQQDLDTTLNNIDNSFPKTSS